jgi:uncharacterized protein
MKRFWLPALLIAGVLWLGGCKESASVEQPVSTPEIDPEYGHLLHAQAKLPTLKVWLGNEELTAEVASKQVEIATGMMYRTNMLENEAMLFVFPDAQPRSFYMRNCIVPLSAAYIDPSGVILQEIDMQPHNETPIPSDSNDVQFVLEVRQGWFQRHNVKTGMVVRTERGSLLDTFFPK